MTTRSIVLAGLLLSMPIPAGQVLAAGAGPLAVAGGLAPHVPGEVLVKYKPSVAARARAASVALQGHALIAELPEPGWAQVRLGAGETVAAAVSAFQNDPGVEYAQPNFLYQARAAPNDPLFGQIWGLKNTAQPITNAYTQPPGSDVPYGTNNPGTLGSDINAEKAWDTITDCSSVVVAVLDTGVNYNHVDLKDNMWKGPPEYPNHGWNFVDGVDGNNNPMDLNGHGTHVAGTIGAVGNNALGVTGVCWKASIMAVRVLGVGGATTANLIRGIDFAIAQKARVINMSLGEHNATFDQAYANAIDRARTANIAVIVAAGNDKGDNDLVNDYPCNFSKTSRNVVCVAGLDQKYALYSESNFGKATVTLGAPATNVLSTWAGTTAEVIPALTSTGGWTTTKTTGGGWGFTRCGTAPDVADCLVDPTTYPGGLYAKGTDDRAYNLLAVAKANSAVVKFDAAWDLGAGDSFNVFFQAGQARTDPFAGGGTKLFQSTGEGTGGALLWREFDVTACQESNCSIGFQLQSGSTGVAAKGVRIQNFYVSSLASNNTSYNTINGTSMATPAVAGVVALVLAYNPLYTWQDVVTAIKESGRPVDSLATRTETGKAIDAMRALAFILPPTGVSAKVQ
jgi:thermitase